MANMHFKLFTASKMKNMYDGLFLKKILILPGDIGVNPGPVNRHQIEKDNFEVFNKGLHFIHLNINSLLNKINKLHCIASSSNATVVD